MDRFIASREVPLVLRTTIGKVTKQDGPFSGSAGGSRPSELASMLSLIWALALLNWILGLGSSGSKLCKYIYYREKHGINISTHSGIGTGTKQPCL